MRPPISRKRSAGKAEGTSSTLKHSHLTTHSGSSYLTDQLEGDSQLEIPREIDLWIVSSQKRGEHGGGAVDNSFFVWDANGTRRASGGGRRNRLGKNADRERDMIVVNAEQLVSVQPPPRIRKLVMWGLPFRSALFVLSHFQEQLEGLHWDVNYHYLSDHQIQQLVEQ